MIAKMSTETEVQVVNNKDKRRRHVVELIEEIMARRRYHGLSLQCRRRGRRHDGPVHGVCLQTLTDPGTNTANY